MDKNAIKKYAVWARRELISLVSRKALQYGITDKEDVSPAVPGVNGTVLSAEEMTRRNSLIAQIKARGYEQVMEEVAYTWFIRFMALRYMEVNGYLPTHDRVFTAEPDPQKTDVKDRMIAQSRALSTLLPRMSPGSEDWTELLFPDNLLHDGGVLRKMLEDIPQDHWKGQVEILGWMHQYYLSEKHDRIINIYQGVVKKEDIPAATQLFTPDWIVRYMVDNSLGRYWIERNPGSRLPEKLAFLVKPKNGGIPFLNETVSPQELTFFDPCMGSGHILVYAFDVLMEIYRERGYTDRQAAGQIILHNLCGLDIDDRCSRLAYFAVMMKARSYDPQFFSRGIKPHVLSIRESNEIRQFTHSKFMPSARWNGVGEYLVELFRHAKEIGSLKTARDLDYDAFQSYLTDCAGHPDAEARQWQREEKPLLAQLAEQAKLLSRKYAVVCTNPPYMGKLDGNLKDYVMEHFRPYSGDLFSVFIYHNFAFCQDRGYAAFMTPFVWMFIKSYGKLRQYLIHNKSITTLIQMEYSAFEEATVPICAFVLKNRREADPGVYFRLSEFTGGMDVQKQKVLEAIADPDCGYVYETAAADFEAIPMTPIAYWISRGMRNAFAKGTGLGHGALARNGMKTGDNGRFLRLWWEVEKAAFNTGATCYEEAEQSCAKWYPYNKGGEFRKWYGNNDYVVNWQNCGEEIFGHAKQDGRNVQDYPRELKFKPALSWSLVTSGKPAFRYKEHNLSDIAGMSLYADEKSIKGYLGLLNSKVALEILKLIAPTINFQAGDIARIPVMQDVLEKDEIISLVEENIACSAADWDCFETSWDFQCHPLIHVVAKNGAILEQRSICLADCYQLWEAECTERFNRLKANEEALNRIFIDLYGLQDELNPEVDPKDVTVRPADKKREIKSLISYAVGCMFGRYSLDVPGLVYAGGEWGDAHYITFQADRGGIIPICDEGYFAGDIVDRFVRFMEAVYGKDTLSENLQFIAEVLEGSGGPEDVLRNYFLNGFYADHLKTYRQRPIYWLFDSGKKNGFKALVYLHRYEPDTVERIRTDYVRQQQAHYRTVIGELEQRLSFATSAERGKLRKQLKKLQEQAAELRLYEEKLRHLARRHIAIDPDAGVRKNYGLFRDVLARIK